MLILGIETSCDETGLALYDTHRGLISQALHSQMKMHADYGGVVPELASRDHILRLVPLLRHCLAAHDLPLGAIDLIAYTQGPGLPGALLTGAGFAHGLAFALDRPTLPIHHLEGHLLSALLADASVAFPFTALIVSGGHTQLMAVNAVGDYSLLGETIDDAAGEAFDKTATLLGLPYPGGPQLARLAEGADAARFRLPRPMLHSPDLDMSFSGLKTAVLTQVRSLQLQDALDEATRRDLAASFQAAVVDVLASKSMAALRQTGHRCLVVAGGVGANRALRDRLQKDVPTVSARVLFPPPEYCTDNGVMIAFAAALRCQGHVAPPAGPVAARHDAFTVRSRWALASA